MRHADVSGTIWLDTTSSEVIKVEFRYGGVLDFLAPEIPRVMQEAREQYPNTSLRFNGITPFNLEFIRGTIEFMQLPDGRTFIRRWEIVTPYLAYTVATQAGRGIDVFGQIRPLATSFEVLAILPR